MKGKKREELDVSTLPEVPTLVCSLNWLTKDSNAKRSKEAIMKTKRLDFLVVTRDDVKTFAKDKGLYLPADDKKKDKGTENLPKEATPSVMADAFTLLIDEHITNKRVEKKDYADAVAAGKPPPAAKKKEEKKKDPKKKKEDEEVEEQEEIFPKSYEYLIIVEDYPMSRHEMLALGKTRGGFDCLVSIEPHFTHKKKELTSDQLAQLEVAGKPQAIAEVDEIQEHDESATLEIPEAKMTSQELAAVDEKRQLTASLAEARAESIPKSKLRGAVALEIDPVIIIEDLNSTWDKLKDQFFKIIADASLLRKEYLEWLKHVTVKPLLKPKIVPKIEDEIPKDDPKDKKSKKEDPKDKKAAKKEQEDAVKEPEVPKIDIPKEQGYIEAQDLLAKMEQKLKVQLEYYKAVNTLDVFASILDKHKQDFDTNRTGFLESSNPAGDELRGDNKEIDNFLDDLFEQVQTAEIGQTIRSRP